MSDPYVYPGSDVLKNKLNITEASRLERVEKRLVTARIGCGIPKGDFDIEHLQAIHRHLFQDIYDWAGTIRVVEMNKGGNQFQFQKYIKTGMTDIHKRLVKTNYLRGTGPIAFAKLAGEIIGDLNYVHPFREGNGRVQLEYLKQLAENAGHPLDLTRLTPERWIEASKEAHLGKYEKMAQAIKSCIPFREKEREHNQGRELER